MGIQGLWPLLEPTATSITLDALEGKRLAIDVSFWLYQAQLGYSKNGQSNNTNISKNPHLSLLINRIAKLLFYKIRPVFVFDGEDIPPQKRQLLRDRCLGRHLRELAANKKVFEKLAREQMQIHSEENSLDSIGTGRMEESSRSSPRKKKVKSVECFEFPSTSAGINNLPSFVVVDSSDTPESEDDELGSANATCPANIDDQIERLKELKEANKTARLHSSEIPLDSKQFSKFQLQRLVTRNKVNVQLQKLKDDRIRGTIPVNSGPERKIIVQDRHMRSHILTREAEIIEMTEYENETGRDFTWTEFVNDRQPAGVGTHSSIPNGIKNSVDYANREESTNESEDEFVDVPNLNLDADGNYSIQQNADSSEPEIEEFMENGSKMNGIPEKYFPVDEFADIGREDKNSEILIDDELSNQESGVFSFNGRPKSEFIARRSAEEEGVFADCQRLFSLLGLPFLQAPGEAEAQCVELERLDLVDGVVSDDSDVWLFGAQRVYKNMFSRKKHVQMYSSEEITKRLGLSRAEFIQIGMLAGGDYSKGLDQVGMVTALELVSEFAIALTNSQEEDKLQKALLSLESVRNWILAKRDSQTDFSESAKRIRLRKIIEGNNSDEKIKAFPSHQVFHAYVSPKVESSRTKFRWSRVDFEDLDTFVQLKLGISADRVDHMTHGALRRWDEFIGRQAQSYQLKMTNYVRPAGAFDGRIGGLSAFDFLPTSRVQKALEKLKKTKENEQENAVTTKGRRATKLSRKRASKGRGRHSADGRAKSRAIGQSGTKKAVQLELSEESSSD